MYFSGTDIGTDTGGDTGGDTGTPVDVETSTEFLAGPDAPDMDASDVVSLFSNEYNSALNGVNSTGWSDGSSTEMDVAGNTVKKFDGVVYTGFDVPGDVSTGSAETLSISLFRTMSSEMEVKLVDLDAGADGFYYIPASDMPVNQWVTVDIPMSSFRGNDSMAGGPIAADHGIDQLILKPMNNFDPTVNGPRETFYMDDMYFSGTDIGTDTGGDTGSDPVDPGTGDGDGDDVATGVVLDFEGFPDNGDGTFALTDGEFTTYGNSMGRGLETVTEVDGSSRTMLAIEKGAGTEWWSGVTLVSEYPGTDMIGDGSDPITMRVYAEQDGNFRLELEADGQAAYTYRHWVQEGWNDLSFDLSGADASVDWHKVQLRPDAWGGAFNPEYVENTTKYYIDDVHFPQGVIVAAPSDPTTDEFLAGPAVAPDAEAADVVSLFSDGYTSALEGVGKTGWSDSGDVTEITVEGNTFKKFDSTTFAGFEPASTIDATGMDTLSISLYRTASSEFEVKLVDYGTDDAYGADNAEVMHYIPAADMPVNQWVTIDIPMADLVAGGLSTSANIGQIILKPMGGTETFYMDDMYFSVAPAPVNTAPVFADATVVVDVDENETVVYQAQATDAEDTVSYTLGGDDAAAFDIEADGTVTFNVAPDYEVDPQSYSFTVTADDGNGGTATQSVTVNVADVTEVVVPPTPTGGEVLTFDDLATDTVEAAVAEFGGVARDIVTVTEEDGSSRQMLSVTKGDGAEPWAGFEFISAYSASDLVGDGTQPVTMRVFADQAGTLTLGLEGNAPKIELSETVEAGWNNVVFDVSSAAAADPSKAVMHIDFASGAATNTGAVTYLIDDVHFPQAVIVEAPVVATPEEAAPAFTADADDVAIFIDAASAGVNVNPGWGQRGSLLPETDAEAGEVLKFSDLNYQGIDLGGSYDVSGKEHVRFDLWSETGGSVKVSVVSPGGEKALDVTITGGEWNTVELDLADYSDVVDLTQVIQLKFDAQNLDDGLNTFYMDNVAFAGTTAPVNENAPEFNYDSVFLQQNENIDTTQVIHSASATDADGDDVTYSLGDDDADAFDIDEEGGVTFAESPDYESGVTSYDFTITASDGSLTDEQAVTVQINNVVEQYTLDPADLASGGEFAGEAMDDRMDGRGSTSALELSGGAGTDVLYGGDAGDVLDGGEGNDQLSGGGGDDVLIAGTGVDRIDGGDGIDTVVLESDDGDMVSINLAREWQYSGDGWNQIVNVENVVTGGGADIIKGNDIGNVVESGAGNDWVYANGGDDVLIGGEGIDRLFGGDGNDTVLYETDEDLVIDLNSEWQLGNGETSEGIDKLIDIENVTTGSGEDVLIGTDGSNILTGGDGDDTLTGGDGADVFRFYSSEGPSTDVITDFTVGEDSIEFIDDTTGAVAQAQITTDADGSMVTWDDLTIMLDVNVNYDDINPITD